MTSDFYFKLCLTFLYITLVIRLGINEIWRNLFYGHYYDLSQTPSQQQNILKRSTLNSIWIPCFLQGRSEHQQCTHNNRLFRLNMRSCYPLHCVPGALSKSTVCRQVYGQKVINRYRFRYTCQPISQSVTLTACTHGIHFDKIKYIL
jgi:hypothetical protein